MHFPRAMTTKRAGSFIALLSHGNLGPRLRLDAPDGLVVSDGRRR